MRIIHKQQLPAITDITIIEVPKDAKILSVQMQPHRVKGNLPTFWYEFDPSETELEKRRIIIVGTGNSFVLTKKMTYIGTLQDFNYLTQILVWHIYEERNS
jgi:hypothetical protein